MKKYYSIRVVTAENRNEAINKVCYGDFDETDRLSDLVLTVEELIKFLKSDDHETTI